METTQANVAWRDLEAFLRNAPGGVLLEVAQPDCPACAVEPPVAPDGLPDGVARARLLLNPEDPTDQEIATALRVDATPTLIGFCMGEELGRTRRWEEADTLINKLRGCSPLPTRQEEGDQHGSV